MKAIKPNFGFDGYCWFVRLPDGQEAGHPLPEKAQQMANRLAKGEVVYMVPREVPRSETRTQS